VIPDDLRYTAQHEWVAGDGSGPVRVGITDFAQDALGDVVYVDIPEEGTEVRAGAAFGEVESTKSVSDLFSPITGKVVSRNEALSENPELINQDPYGEGWIVVVEMSDRDELDDLMDAQTYEQTVEAGGDQE
jgi:glycine cleavage system H protein